MHCLVRGSINLDEYYYVTHISRPGETISSHGFQQRMGGKGFNQAVALALATGGASEGKVSFFGTVGDDEAGKGLKDKLLSRWGLNNDTLFQDPAKATGRAIIQVADDGENSIILFPGANHSKLIEEEEKPWPVGTTHLLLQNEISLESTMKALDSATGVITIFNPSPMLSKEEVLRFPWEKVNWLIVNELEARSLLAFFAPQKSPDDIPMVLKMLSEHSVLATTIIVCTLGARGVMGYIPGSPFVMLGLPAASLGGPVVDTTGAGDTFTGYLVAGLMKLPNGGQTIRADDFEGLLQGATRAAAMCVERAGTADSMPTAEEVERRFGSSRT